MSLSTADYSFIVTNTLGVCGILWYQYFLVKIKAKTRLELIIIAMMSMMSLGIGARALNSFLINNGIVLSILPILKSIAASTIPLIYLLYSEAILRKHSPMWMKMIVSLATLFFTITAFAGEFLSNSITVKIFVGYMGCYLLMMTFLFVSRDKKSLTRGENSMVDASLVALWAMVPLYITDYKLFYDIVPGRFGIIGALLFCYTTIRSYMSSDKKRTMCKELTASFLQSIGIAYLSIYFVPTQTLELFLQVFTLALTVLLLFRISVRVKSLQVKSRSSQFMRWIAESDMTSLPEFVKSFKNLRSEEEFCVLSGSALDGYDHFKMLEFIESLDRSALSLNYIKQVVEIYKQTNHEMAFGGEQLVDILMRNEMNYVCILSNIPLSLFLINVAQAGQEELVELEVTMIQKLGYLIGRGHVSAQRM